MTDTYAWSSDNRPRPSVRVDVRRGDVIEASWDLEEPTPEAVADALAVFERLAGVVLTRDGAA